MVVLGIRPRLLRLEVGMDRTVGARVGVKSGLCRKPLSLAVVVNGRLVLDLGLPSPGTVVLEEVLEHYLIASLSGIEPHSHGLRVAISSTNGLVRWVLSLASTIAD
jgi:hypothetical protein